jgi:hypothetical protein
MHWPSICEDQLMQAVVLVRSYLSQGTYKVELHGKANSVLLLATTTGCQSTEPLYDIRAL